MASSLRKDSSWLLLPRASGVYAIAGKLSGKVYIGSAVNIQKRIRQHFSRLEARKHGNAHLQSAWNLYGRDGFSVRVLDLVSTDALIIVEQSFIDQYDAANSVHGYNLFPNARSPLGFKHSDKSKLKMREACKKRSPVSDATRALFSAMRKGVKRGAAFSKKMSEVQRGRPVSSEQRAKIAGTLRGRTLSQEHRAKISAGLVGHRMTPNQIAGLIARNTGRIVSAETRAQTAASLRGRTMSAEACAKMSESQKLRWAAIRAGVAA